jgi:hypothetical protein
MHTRAHKHTPHTHTNTHTPADMGVVRTDDANLEMQLLELVRELAHERRVSLSLSLSCSLPLSLSHSHSLALALALSIALLLSRSLALALSLFRSFALSLSPTHMCIYMYACRTRRVSINTYICACTCAQDKNEKKKWTRRRCGPVCNGSCTSLMAVAPVCGPLCGSHLFVCLSFLFYTNLCVSLWVSFYTFWVSFDSTFEYRTKKRYGAGCNGNWTLPTARS